MGAKKISYDHLREERKLQIATELDEKIDKRSCDLKDNESLRSVVLCLVSSQHYEDAVNILENYPLKFERFVEFQLRVTPYLKHCQNLITSIELKRNFPQVTDMPMIKQHELVDKVVNDFGELKIFLTRIEAMNTEEVFKDILSMKILIRTAFFCVFIFSLSVSVYSIGWDGLSFVNSWLDELTMSVSNFLFGLF